MAQDETHPTPARAPARLALLGLLAAGAISTAGFVVARFQQPARPAAPPDAPPSAELAALAGKHLRNWPAGRKPDLVLLLTGEQHNYEQPCGCSEPQLGGLERRYNFVKFLRDQGLAVAPVDLGDVYFDHTAPGRPGLPQQLLLKYKTSMRALSLMGYEAVCVGRHEFGLPLLTALSETVLNEKQTFQVLAANVKDRPLNYPAADGGSMVGEFKVTATPVKVGVAGTIGQSVINAVARVDPNVKFENNGQVLPAVLAAMNAQRPDVRVLLYQGTLAEAKKLAEVIPDFDIVLCLSDQSDPPGTTTDVKDPKTQKVTRIAQVGHKGRYVGVFGVFRNADRSLDFRYDLVPMTGEFRTPEEQVKANAGIQLLEKYTAEVRDKDYLGLYPQVPHPAQVLFPIEKDRFHPHFVGSDRCKACHEKDYEVWDASRHAKAIETLAENTKRPKNRQFDGECIVCHTVGFGYHTGYRDQKRTPHLAGVGCESCHGPGSLHADQPGNRPYRLAMSPWKRKPEDAITSEEVAKVIFKTCFGCHDTDNDPKFDLATYWPKVGHGKNAKALKK